MDSRVYKYKRTKNKNPTVQELQRQWNSNMNKANTKRAQVTQKLNDMYQDKGDKRSKKQQ